MEKHTLKLERHVNRIQIDERKWQKVVLVDLVVSKVVE